MADRTLRIWSPGPWDFESDELSFTADGYPALIRRNPSLGMLCGYVGVPKGHPWHGQHYDDLPVRVHGGLTFSGILHDDDPERWWIGFDCGHMMDVVPMFLNLHPPSEGATYKTVDYVTAEIQKLARQVKAAEPRGKTRTVLDRIIKTGKMLFC